MRCKLWPWPSRRTFAQSSLCLGTFSMSLSEDNPSSKIECLRFSHQKQMGQFFGRRTAAVGLHATCGCQAARNRYRMVQWSTGCAPACSFPWHELLVEPVHLCKHILTHHDKVVLNGMPFAERPTEEAVGQLMQNSDTIALTSGFVIGHTCWKGRACPNMLSLSGQAWLRMR